MDRRSAGRSTTAGPCAARYMSLFGSLRSASDTLTAAPNDTVARATVIQRAGELGRSFNRTATALLEAEQAGTSQIGDAVSNINRLAGSVRDLNAAVHQNASAAIDAAVDARIHS